MKFEIVQSPFFNEIIKAASLTFLHSLWQGVVASVLAGGFLMLTRKSRPAFRYNVLVGLLASLLLVNAATFFMVLPNAAGAISGTVFYSAEHAASAASLAKTIATPESGTFLPQVVTCCHANASVILAIWLFVFLWKSLRATVGLLHLKKLRRSGIHYPPACWKDTFADLTRKLGIQQRLQFLESENVVVPMVIGYAKPVVLVPLGMLAGMPAAQVEAILLHELAHIRRRDYLVNLVQIFCENIYFFNPAMLWISYLIREEREHCCDDLAIGVSENRSSLIHALVSFQEYHLTGRAGAGSLAHMAFAGKKNHLLNRIKRIIDHNNQSLNAMEKLFVTLSLAAAIGLSAAIAPQTHSQNVAQHDKQRIYAVPAPPAPPAPAEVDTVPMPAEPAEPLAPEEPAEPAEPAEPLEMIAHVPSEGISTYHITVEGKEYEIVKKSERIIYLAIDDKEIAASDYGKYKATIEKIEKEVKIAHENAEKERRNADKQRSEADLQRRLAQEARHEAAQQRAEANVQRQQAAVMRVQAEQNREHAAEMRKHAEIMREQADRHRMDADRMREEAEKQRGEAEVMREKAAHDREVYEQKQAGLIHDLIQEGVIRNAENLSFQLGTNALIVNGKKQSKELHEKLKARYLEGQNAEMVYNYKGRTGYTVTGLIHEK